MPYARMIAQITRTAFDNEMSPIERPWTTLHVPSR